MGEGQGGPAVGFPGERRRSRRSRRGGFGQRPGECHNFQNRLPVTWDRLQWQIYKVSCPHFIYVLYACCLHFCHCHTWCLNKDRKMRVILQREEQVGLSLTVRPLLISNTEQNCGDVTELYWFLIAVWCQLVEVCCYPIKQQLIEYCKCGGETFYLVWVVQLTTFFYATIFAAKV